MEVRQLPRLSDDERRDVRAEGQLDVEMGTLTDCTWQRFRVDPLVVDDGGGRGFANAIGGKSLWYNADLLLHQWVTPAEVYGLPEASDSWVQYLDDAPKVVSFCNERTGERRDTHRTVAGPIE